MKKILVAYDGTEGAERALRTTIDLAKAFDAQVGVISVIPIHPARITVDPWDDRPVHEEQLRKARAILVNEGIEPVLIEPAGPPAIEIENAAERGGYDTIVVGSRGLNPLNRVLQGSVSEHIATHAKETVIVVR
jgi:nucleotide-binding universal stress UspA family protein